MEQYSGEHVAAIFAMVCAGALAVWLARTAGRRRAERAAPVLALVIAGAYLTEHLTYAARGEWTASVNLPFHLSDAVTLVAIAALCRPQTPLLVEALFYWAFSASLQAVLTPSIDEPFPDVLYFTYFTTHGGAIVAACLLVLGCRRLPRRGAVLRVYALTLVFAGLAGAASAVTGGNYMFLRAKPPRASLLDLMGPWPWYILTGAVIALAVLLALAALVEALRRERGPGPAEGAAGTGSRTPS
ncbi:MAG: ABC transporter, permease protein [uncultured Solirubrobacteraceae bacterium]|uniref:ABC transporter, permease protein n=1 Tax=uncultured Solirubrobacteraceae bacterium TaxID=1162706 RepID=A0A6J4RSJ9_9ACTN|nr:MAG: ABC transporter, permease protein [uncultured Solirubrobacteraceae bacterium]